MQEKQEKIKELYYNLGNKIDDVLAGAYQEYNMNQKDESEKLHYQENSAHEVQWHSPEIIDDEDRKAIDLAFDSEKIKFSLDMKNNQHIVSLEFQEAYALPEKYIEKMRSALYKCKDFLKYEGGKI